MKLRHSDRIEVKTVDGKGRGVFARCAIKKGQRIERVPVIELPKADIFNNTQNSTLANYVFRWKKKTVVLSLGYGSLYNHSYRPNARYYEDGSDRQVFIALRNIEKGEEITVNYNGDPKCKTPLHFDVV